MWLSTKLVTIASIIAAFSVILALYSALRRSITIINARKRGWGLQVYMIIMLLAMMVSGLVLGTGSPSYDWLMQAIVSPLSSVNYSILTFYMASAGARAFRARSPQATILIVVGIIVLLQQAPVTGIYLPFMNDLALIGTDALALAISRMFTMAVSIGAIVLGVRVLLGREVGFLGYVEE
jgi:predicted membrane protein